MNTAKFIEKNVITVFTFVPIFSATVSAFHLNNFLALGNPLWLSIVLAATYEIANLATLFVVIIIRNINKFFVWTSFFLLIIMQVIGNVYYSFEYIYKMLDKHPWWVDIYIKFSNVFFNEAMTSDMRIFWLSVIIGVPVPAVALLLTKSIADHLDYEHEEKLEAEEEINNVVNGGSTENGIEVEI